MKVYRDLYLFGEPPQVSATIGAIERSLTDGWTRDKVAESRVKAGGADGAAYCFACQETGTRKAAELFLREKVPGEWYVSNIVPLQNGQLSFDEYNSILEDFCDRYIKPFAQQHGVKVEITDSQASLELWMSSETAKKLRAFSACANKSSRTLHPVDRHRWLDFLVAAHSEKSQLSETNLYRWLTEVDGWAVDAASRLAGDYVDARELLSRNDKRSGAA